MTPGLPTMPFEVADRFTVILNFFGRARVLNSNGLKFSCMRDRAALRCALGLEFSSWLFFLCFLAFSGALIPCSLKDSFRRFN